MTEMEARVLRDLEAEERRSRPRPRGSRAIGSALIAIVAVFVAGGLTLAAEKRTPTPKERPAVVTPQGTISFGESAPMTPAQQRKFLLKWPEMTQREVDDLTAALKFTGAPPTQVMIVCKDPMCEDLALNLDNAFESARWKSEIIVGTQFGVPAGVSTSSKWLADVLNGATANRYGAKVEAEPSLVRCDTKAPCPQKPEYVLIGSKPR